MVHMKRLSRSSQGDRETGAGFGDRIRLHVPSRVQDHQTTHIWPWLPGPGSHPCPLNSKSQRTGATYTRSPATVFLILLQ